MDIDQAQPFDPRQQIRSNSYEIFYYRDEQLGRVSIHHHDFYELYLFLKGNVEFIVEGHTYVPQPGDLLLINPFELHQLRIRQPREAYERIVLWLAPEYLSQISTAQTSLTRCFDGSWPKHSNILRQPHLHQNKVETLLRALLRESRQNRYGADVAARGIVSQLMVEVNRLAIANAPQHSPENRAAEQIQRVLEYIEKHYDQPLSLDQLAGEFFISKYYLSHEFRKQVGASVYRYIIQKRLVIAKQLLSGGVSPTDVYQNCGFRDYSSFYRAFKAEYGLSPNAFLKSQPKSGKSQKKARESCHN